MEKRTLLALAISFLVLGFYPLILQRFYPDYYKDHPSVAKTTEVSNRSLRQDSVPKIDTKAEGFSSEDDWLDYRLEHDPRFLSRVAQSRQSLREGKGIKIEDLQKKD